MGCPWAARPRPGPARHNQGCARLTPKRLGTACMSDTGRTDPGTTGPVLGRPCQADFHPYLCILWPWLFIVGITMNGLHGRNCLEIKEKDYSFLGSLAPLPSAHCGPGCSSSRHHYEWLTWEKLVRSSLSTKSDLLPKYLVIFLVVNPSHLPLGPIT